MINILEYMSVTGQNQIQVKEIDNQPRLKNFNLNLILTCDISTIQVHLYILAGCLQEF